MSLTGLLISNIGGPFAIAGGNAARVALGDLYKDEPVEIAKWTGLMAMAMSVGSVFGPYVSSVLTARDLRLPYIASACVCALHLCLVAR